MRRSLAAAILALLLSGTAFAQNAEPEGSVEGWFYTQVNHDFKSGIYLTGYWEYDTREFNSLSCTYGRFSLGCKVLPWLKLGANYVPSYHTSGWSQYMELDAVGTLKSGDFKVSVRERWRHGIFGTSKNELRSRLKVEYSIPDSDFSVCLAPEVFTWGTQWLKTRHYVVGSYSVNDHVELELFYMYYAYNNVPADHIVGLGVNFDI